MGQDNSKGHCGKMAAGATTVIELLRIAARAQHVAAELAAALIAVRASSDTLLSVFTKAEARQVSVTDYVKLMRARGAVLRDAEHAMALFRRHDVRRAGALRESDLARCFLHRERRPLNSVGQPVELPSWAAGRALQPADLVALAMHKEIETLQKLSLHLLAHPVDVAATFRDVIRHAAAGEPRGSITEPMLQRWVGERLPPAEIHAAVKWLDLDDDGALTLLEWADFLTPLPEFRSRGAVESLSSLPPPLPPPEEEEEQQQQQQQQQQPRTQTPAPDRRRESEPTGPNQPAKGQQPVVTQQRRRRRLQTPARVYESRYSDGYESGGGGASPTRSVVRDVAASPICTSHSPSSSSNASEVATPAAPPPAASLSPLRASELRSPTRSPRQRRALVGLHVLAPAPFVTPPRGPRLSLGDVVSPLRNARALGPHESPPTAAAVFLADVRSDAEVLARFLREAAIVEERAEELRRHLAEQPDFSLDAALHAIELPRGADDGRVHVEGVLAFLAVSDPASAPVALGPLWRRLAGPESDARNVEPFPAISRAQFIRAILPWDPVLSDRIVHRSSRREPDAHKRLSERTRCLFAAFLRELAALEARVDAWRDLLARRRANLLSLFSAIRPSKGGTASPSEISMFIEQHSPHRGAAVQHKALDVIPWLLSPSDGASHPPTSSEQSQANSSMTTDAAITPQRLHLLLGRFGAVESLSYGAFVSEVLPSVF